MRVMFAVVVLVSYLCLVLGDYGCVCDYEFGFINSVNDDQGGWSYRYDTKPDYGYRRFYSTLLFQSLSWRMSIVFFFLVFFLLLFFSFFLFFFFSLSFFFCFVCLFVCLFVCFFLSFFLSSGSCFSCSCSSFPSFSFSFSFSSFLVVCSRSEYSFASCAWLQGFYLPSFLPRLLNIALHNMHCLLLPVPP